MKYGNNPSGDCAGFTNRENMICNEVFQMQRDGTVTTGDFCIKVLTTRQEVKFGVDCMMQLVLKQIRPQNVPEDKFEGMRAYSIPFMVISMRPGR